MQEDTLASCLSHNLAWTVRCGTDIYAPDTRQWTGLYIEPEPKGG